MRTFFSLALLFASASAYAAPATWSVTAVEGHLYYHKNGSVDATDYFTGTALWNTFIGEGGAAAPSTMSVLYVDVEGPVTPGGASGTARVQAWSKGAPKPFLDQSFKLDTYFVSAGEKIRLPLIMSNPNGEFVVKAWLENVGGKPGKTPVVEKSASFDGGE